MLGAMEDTDQVLLQAAVREGRGKVCGGAAVDKAHISSALSADLTMGPIACTKLDPVEVVKKMKELSQCTGS